MYVEYEDIQSCNTFEVYYDFILILNIGKSILGVIFVYWKLGKCVVTFQRYVGYNPTLILPPRNKVED
jgi:hypothetical protein